MSQHPILDASVGGVWATLTLVNINMVITVIAGIFAIVYYGLLILKEVERRNHVRKRPPEHTFKE